MQNTRLAFKAVAIETNKEKVMADYKEGDQIRVLIGVFRGKQGKVTTVVPEQEKSLGVILKQDGPVYTTWFRPHEIERDGRESH